MIGQWTHGFFWERQGTEADAFLDKQKVKKKLAAAETAAEASITALRMALTLSASTKKRHWNLSTLRKKAKSIC